MEPPLAFGLRHETNRHRIEKAFNFAYTHILTKKSNNSSNDLWTASEFQVVERNGAVASNTANDAAQASTGDDELVFNEPSFDEDKEDDGGPYKPSYSKYTISLSSLPSLGRRSSRRDTSPSPHSATQPRPLTMTPSTPPNAGTQADMPSTNRTIPIRQGIDRSRIADFAVAYLKTRPEFSSIFGIRTPLFQPVYVPIVVEGKRPPPRTQDPSKLQGRWMRQLLLYMNLGKRDIIEKMTAFFSVYPSRSYVGIAFTGPWWIFTLCTPGAKENTLRWSKAFAYHTPEHDNALNIIFEAAQNHPADPRADEKLMELLDNYEDEPGMVTFVETDTPVVD
ncbi:hypothetical protein FRC08_006323 [Ceratobasidium sp. 394]|nr:hypothetical protein FRC08_006323 [Ceratobasidium sp. 394]KAG9093859.1 hypothetical protein FS749_013615 [Ceratobasidium sp. UAMH 11750]